MKVLIVEDEIRLAELIGRTLNREKIETTIVHDGHAGLEAAGDGTYDVVILDRMLPVLDGLQVVRELRRRQVQTPVLMLTALGDMPERVEGLSAGADDYLGKPFAFEELIARTRALARRVDRPMAPDAIELGMVNVDLRLHRVTRDGIAIDLSPREFDLLETLVRHRGQVLSRDQLLRRVWGASAEPAGNIVDLYIHYLRKKLDPHGVDDPPLIRTVRGLGYAVV